jgi:hypothetical protein
MYYVLHHSKGALMLAADDLHQAVQWSQRQLGEDLGLMSVMETECSDSINMVEKSGTGLRAASPDGCRPVLSVMANTIDRVVGTQREAVLSSDWGRNCLVKARTPTMH